MKLPELPCAGGSCPTMGDVLPDKYNACQMIAKQLVELGAAGLFEADPCPFKVSLLLHERLAEQSN